jgi:serine/threonine protein kinase
MSYNNDQFWGSGAYNRDFIRLCQYAFEAQPRYQRMSGSNGSAIKVTVDGRPYWVKRVIEYTDIRYGSRPTVEQIKSYKRNWNVLNSEITAAWALTAAIPDYVSNLHAASIQTKIRDDNNTIYVVAWLVFEAPRGLTLKAFIDEKKYLYGSITRDLSEILYCMIQRARFFLNGAGFVHRDIKPDNIFVLTDASGEPVACKLIDFGFTVREGERHGAIATPDFKPPTFPLLYTPHIVSRSQNEYSTGKIWSLASVLGQSGSPPDNSKCMSILSSSAARGTPSYGGGGGGGGATPSYGGGGGGGAPSYGGGGGGGGAPSYVQRYQVDPSVQRVLDAAAAAATAVPTSRSKLLGSARAVAQAATGASKGPPLPPMNLPVKPNNNCCKCAGSFFGCCPCGKHKKEGGSRRLYKNKRRKTIRKSPYKKRK